MKKSDAQKAQKKNEAKQKISKLDQDALRYHEFPIAGKLEINPTKPLANQRDLSLAYSPGVAAACLEIVKDPSNAFKYTARSNMVAVITNGTAVLGLGNIGPLAAKPVMEGKAILFRKFANINSIDLEIDQKDPEKFIEAVASLEPSFGGINLEDIKAPECFMIEDELKKRMNIPVFHDDQHGTAIIVTAAVMNGLKVSGKNIKDAKIVISGAGAAALACLELLIDMGLNLKNVHIFDMQGEVVEEREDLEPKRKQYARKGKAMTIKEALKGADIFLGLSAADILSKDDIVGMAKSPLVFALANPNPEIKPELTKSVRKDAIIATGRSDYPNQVNNVLCFPYLFRGALDCQASEINKEMKIAAVKAIANLASQGHDDRSKTAYAGESMKFGSEYLIPKPFDSRLLVAISPAVAEAATKSGVAKKPIEDIKAYKDKLNQFIFRSGLVMKPIFESARQTQKRVIYAEGEDERVIRAVNILVEERMVKPILIGRHAVVEARLEKFAPDLKIGKNVELINPEKDERYPNYWRKYLNLMDRRGVTPEIARHTIHTQPTVIGAIALHLNDADAMVCGVIGSYQDHLKKLEVLIPKKKGVDNFASMMMLIINNRDPLFICDTHAYDRRSPLDIANTAQLAAKSIARFGLEPKVAFLSHSNFGSSNSKSAIMMREASKIFATLEPKIMQDGEMHADAALDPTVRKNIILKSRMRGGSANLLVMPNLDAANITYNSIKILTDAQLVGPILLGGKFAAHILTNSATSRGIVNISALGVVQSTVSKTHKTVE